MGQHFSKTAFLSSSLTSVADLWIMSVSVPANVALRAFSTLGRYSVFHSSCSAWVNAGDWPGKGVLIVRWKTVCDGQHNICFLELSNDRTRCSTTGPISCMSGTPVVPVPMIPTLLPLTSRHLGHTVVWKQWPWKVPARRPAISGMYGVEA